MSSLADTPLEIRRKIVNMLPTAQDQLEFEVASKATRTFPDAFTARARYRTMSPDQRNRRLAQHALKAADPGLPDNIRSGSRKKARMLADEFGAHDPVYAVLFDDIDMALQFMLVTPEGRPNPLHLAAGMSSAGIRMPNEALAVKLVRTVPPHVLRHCVLGGKTALFYAIETGQTRTVAALLEANQAVLFDRSDNQDPLNFAAARNRLDIVRTIMNGNPRWFRQFHQIMRSNPALALRLATGLASNQAAVLASPEPGWSSTLYKILYHIVLGDLRRMTRDSMEPIVAALASRVPLGKSERVNIQRLVAGAGPSWLVPLFA